MYRIYEVEMQQLVVEMDKKIHIKVFTKWQ
jgi:hypothetical protein